MTSVAPMTTTLSAHLASLAKRADLPADVRESLAVAAQHTEHVQGCTGCDAWTESPDDLGRCDQCAIACSGCAKALECEDDGFRTAGGDLLCEACADDREPHDRGCICRECGDRRERALEDRAEALAFERRMEGRL